MPLRLQQLRQPGEIPKRTRQAWFNTLKQRLWQLGVGQIPQILLVSHEQTPERAHCWRCC